MIYIIIGLIIYSLILTLFVVRVNNRLDEIEFKSTLDKSIDNTNVAQETIDKIIDELDKVDKKESFVGVIPDIKPDDLFLDEEELIFEPETTMIPSPPDLDNISQQFDKLLEGKSREEMEEWLGMKNNKPQQELKKLNQNYKSY